TSEFQVTDAEDETQKLKKPWKALFTLTRVRTAGVVVVVNDGVDLVIVTAMMLVLVLLMVMMRITTAMTKMLLISNGVTDGDDDCDVDGDVDGDGGGDGGGDDNDDVDDYGDGGGAGELGEEPFVLLLTGGGVTGKGMKRYVQDVNNQPSEGVKQANCFLAAWAWELWEADWVPLYARFGGIFGLLVCAAGFGVPKTLVLLGRLVIGSVLLRRLLRSVFRIPSRHCAFRGVQMEAGDLRDF
ncbi:unnamed protein product, partial [Symbiodinium sp. KB8]